MNPVRPRRPGPRSRTSTKQGRCKPTGKQRFPTFDAAVAAAVRVSRHTGPLRTYRCPDCTGWHLTRLPRWDPR